MRFLFSVLLPLLLCVSAMGGPFYNRNNVYCTNVPPGVRKMFRGVDITSLDLQPLEIVGDNGYKSPVIKMRCAKPKSWLRGGYKYDLPDQVWTMTSTPGGLLSTDVQVYKTSAALRESLVKTVNANNREKEYVFTLSGSFTHMQDKIMNSSAYYFDTAAIDAVNRVDLLPHWALELDDYAQDYLKNVIRNAPYTSNPEAYHGFVEQFGTHFFIVARFGGMIRVLQRTGSNYFTAHSEERAQIYARKNFFKTINGLVNTDGGETTEVDQDESEFAASTSRMVKYYGGSTNLLTFNGTRAWQTTIENDPWLISGELRSISDLIRNDVQREGVRVATWQHMLRRYLDELYRKCMARKGILGPRVDPLVARIRALYATTLGGLVEAEVAALKADIDRD